MAIIVVTLVELVMRGAPWSEHGYHRSKNAHAPAAGANGVTPPALCLALGAGERRGARSCR